MKVTPSASAGLEKAAIVLPSSPAGADPDLPATVAGSLRAAGSAFGRSAEAFLDEAHGLAGQLLVTASGHLLAAARVCQDEGAAARSAAAAAHPGVVAKEAPNGMQRATLVYDEYFGLARAETATPLQVLVAAAPTVAGMALDLSRASISSDLKAALAREAALMASVAAPAGGLPNDAALPASPGRELELDPLVRWKIGHRLFGLTCRAVADTIRMADRSLARGDAEEAAAKLSEAAWRFYSVTAAMEYASACSSRSYVRSIRPTMAPPALAVELAGSMNLDYRVLKKSLMLLLGKLDRPYTALRRDTPALAVARDELLHADLADHEHHIALAFRLVGAQPALDETDQGSAVQTLRAMHQDLLGRYGPMLRHGYITAGRAELREDRAS